MGRNEEHTRKAPAQLAASLAGFFVAYLVAARLGENLALIPGLSITFWPPAGLFLAMLLVGDRRQWVWTIAAGVAAEMACNALWFHHPVGPAFLYSLSNAAEALTGACLVAALAGDNFRIERLRDVCIFVLAAVLAPTVGATGIALVDHVLGRHPFGVSWPFVWLGDSSGLVVSTPLTLFILHTWRSRTKVATVEAVEAAIVSLLVITVCGMAFRGYLPTPFLALPFLLWAAVRFRLAGASVAVAGQTLLIATMAVVDRDRILVDPQGAHDRIVMYQVFLAVSAVSCLMVAALATQYHEALATLKSANLGLESTVQARTADLVASEAQLRLFIERAPAAIAMLDRDGRYLEASRKWIELFGLTDELSGQPHDDSAFRESDTWSAASSLALQGETVSVPRDRIQSHNGHALWVKWDQQPWWLPDGSVGGVLVSVEDITDQIQVEQTLREADRRKDEFLAVLAHELRNPLAPIRTGLDVLKHNDSQELRDEVVGMMDRQVIHLVSLVDDLLDISRLSRGKIELRLETVDLREKVRGAVEATRGLIHERRHHLTIELPDEPVWARGDRVRLVQVFANILSNAAKYTHTGGSITARLRVDSNVCVFSVSDTGVGLDANDLNRVWEMFGQAPNRELSSGGLGIGLALVRNLVHLHSGRVWAESEGRGHGSTFVVELPLSTGPQPLSSPLPRPSAIDLTAMKVVVIEDNTDILKAMSRLLSLQGCEVYPFSSGEKALAGMDSLDPDAILCDVGMPEMDGFEVARRLRAIPRFGSTLMVALTGYGSEQDRQACYEAGFDRHLTKPVSGDTLSRALGRARDPVNAG